MRLVQISSGRMDTETRKKHHRGWFRVFRAGNTMVEVWTGNYWTLWVRR